MIQSLSHLSHEGCYALCYLAYHLKEHLIHERSGILCDPAEISYFADATRLADCLLEGTDMSHKLCAADLLKMIEER